MRFQFASYALVLLGMLVSLDFLTAS